MDIKTVKQAATETHWTISKQYQNNSKQYSNNSNKDLFFGFFFGPLRTTGSAP